METPAPAMPLDYAPRPPIYRRRIKQIVTAILLIAIAVTTYHWGPALWKKSQVLYWQRQCLNYNPPPDLVVYDVDPAGKSTLLGHGDYVALQSQNFGPFTLIPAAYVPPCFTKYCQTMPLPAPTTGSGTLLFMHEMRSPQGSKYLVIIRSNNDWPNTPYFVTGWDMLVSTLQSATLITPAVDKSCAYEFSLDDLWAIAPIDNRDFKPRGKSHNQLDQIVIRPPLRVRIYAGQIDPTDASHFTIKYEVDGKPYRADGWLHENTPGVPVVEMHRIGN